MIYSHIDFFFSLEVTRKNIYHACFINQLPKVFFGSDYLDIDRSRTIYSYIDFFSPKKLRGRTSIMLASFIKQLLRTYKDDFVSYYLDIDF